MTRSYSFPILLSSLLFVTIAISALNTQTPLWLVHYHFPVWQIGLVGSSYFVGNLVGTLMANWMIVKVKVKLTYAYVCALFAVATLCMSLSIDLYSWALWRFLIGIACAVAWVIVESCILVTSSTKTRSKMVGIYMTTYYLGSVFGQGLLHYFPQSILYFGLVITLLMGVAALFVALTHYHLPHKKPRAFSLVSMIKYKPARLGLVGCIIAGMIMGGVYALLPAYYAQLGLDNDQVANWIMLIILSGLLAQLPMGYLADKYGTQLVLLIETVIFVLACLMIVNNLYPILATILIGVTIYTVYPLSMAWACRAVKKKEIVLMNQTMLFVNTLGSLIAPVIISIAMDWFGHQYLFICFMIIAIYFIILLAVNLVNSQRGHYA